MPRLLPRVCRRRRRPCRKWCIDLSHDAPICRAVSVCVRVNEIFIVIYEQWVSGSGLDLVVRIRMTFCVSQFGTKVKPHTSTCHAAVCLLPFLPFFFFPLHLFLRVRFYLHVERAQNTRHRTHSRKFTGAHNFAVSFANTRAVPNSNTRKMSETELWLTRFTCVRTLMKSCGPCDRVCFWDCLQRERRNFSEFH